MFFRAILLVALFSTSTRGQTAVESCIGSKCKTYQNVNTLWCYSDPDHYCQCRAAAAGQPWKEQVMPCADGTKFSFKRQVCVRQELWDKSECLSTGMGGANTVVDSPCTQNCSTYADIVKLRCHPKNAKAFCQCRPTDVPKVFTPVKMPCANGTTFSFQRQTCMADALWTNSCPQKIK
ncbi:uncharacterized protein LOC129724803 [Wyeomyia smithii]|uniref:uncharacterized protein LOC129724803 n=1 Tax=Wyeomyia smithii TaxID=174621 RepID=UPI002467C225|nr:uncharacterized protein LOC129724803 [Wyeomyia smithii]